MFIILLIIIYFFIQANGNSPLQVLPYQRDTLTLFYVYAVAD